MKFRLKKIYLCLLFVFIAFSCGSNKDNNEQEEEKKKFYGIQLYSLQHTSLDKIKIEALNIHELYCIDTYILQRDGGQSILIGNYSSKQNANGDLLLIKEYFPDAWVVECYSDSILTKYIKNMSFLNVDSIKYELIKKTQIQMTDTADTYEKLVLKHDTDIVNGVSFSHDEDLFHFEHVLSNLGEQHKSGQRIYWGLPFTLGQYQNNNDSALPQYLSFTNSIDEYNEKPFEIECNIPGINKTVRHIYNKKGLKYNYYQAEIAFSIIGKQEYQRISKKISNGTPIKLYVKYQIYAQENVRIIVLGAGLIEPNGNIIYKWTS